MQRLAVFCGANKGVRSDYVDAARAVGAALGRRKMQVAYGGGSTGMMGALADAVLGAGGAIVGVIPQSMVKGEVAHRSLTELRIVATMHDRKAAMYDLADGFIILPGGIGTMDELFEVLVWLHLGYHRKPVGLLDVAGFFDGLVTFLDHMQAEGFMRATVRDLLVTDASIDGLIDRMTAFKPPELPAFMR